ncbi:hypothetical protein GW916_11120 [bacterium]|nr:hypothetical protein [bacterium]
MKKTMLIATTIIFLATNTNAIAKGSAPHEVAHYQERSLERLSSRAGVYPESLEGFYSSLQSRPRLQFNELTCLQYLDNSDRNAFLNCMAQLGKTSLTAEMGKQLFLKRAELLQESSTRENVQNLALIGFVEDLVRDNLRSKGHSATWITRQGYQRYNNKNDFQFKDGDVVIGLGNSSISSMISQINNTPSRYSHAFIVRVRNGKMTTVESLIETGVEEFPLQHLLDDPYNQLTVLRWKSSANRATITRAASDWALAAAKRKAPYDIEMDFDEDYAIYCSELIVKAYAHATGMNPREILNDFSTVKSKKAFEFAQNLGVEKEVYASPGDIFNSPYFEVVAEYRKPGDLMKAWELYLMGDLFFERIEQGYQVFPDPLYTGLPIAVWIAQLLPSIFHEDARLIPKSIGPWAMSIMATAELKIYNIAMKAFTDNNGGSRSLLTHSPWAVQGIFEYEMDRHITLRSSFHIPKKKEKRPGPPHRRR